MKQSRWKESGVGDAGVRTMKQRRRKRLTPQTRTVELLVASDSGQDGKWKPPSEYSARIITINWTG